MSRKKHRHTEITNEVVMAVSIAQVKKSARVRIELLCVDSEEAELLVGALRQQLKHNHITMEFGHDKE